MISSTPSLSSRQAFTLIELLVVIGILAVLGSLLFPVMKRAREKAAESACLSNLRQIGTAAFQYAQDNNGYLPSFRGPGWDISWPALLKNGGYINDQRVFTCPTARVDERTAFTKPQEGYGSNPPCDYAINAMVGGDGAFSPKSDPDKVGKPAYPSEAGLFVDGTDFGWFWAPWGDPFDEKGFGANKFRHNKGLNIFFMDGHVATRRTKADFPEVNGEPYYFWVWAFNQEAIHSL